MKFRYSSDQKLEIGIGRYNRIPRDNRLCRACVNVIEDEMHFHCSCPGYNTVRALYFGTETETLTTEIGKSISTIFFVGFPYPLFFEGWGIFSPPTTSLPVPGFFLFNMLFQSTSSISMCISRTVRSGFPMFPWISRKAEILILNGFEP